MQYADGIPSSVIHFTTIFMVYIKRVVQRHSVHCISVVHIWLSFKWMNNVLWGRIYVNYISTNSAKDLLVIINYNKYTHGNPSSFHIVHYIVIAMCMRYSY